MNELKTRCQENNLEAFSQWLQQEPDVLSESDVVDLVENAAYNDRGPSCSIDGLNPALKLKRPPSSALGFALEYGTRISFLC